MKKITTIMLFSLFSLMLLSWCWNKKVDNIEIKEEVKQDIVENQIEEENTTWIEIAEKLKVPELTESDLKYFDKEKFNESQQDYEDELDNFLSGWEKEEKNNDEIIEEDIKEKDNEEIIKENINKEEVKEEQKQEKTSKNKEKSTTNKKENNTEKKINETTTNKNQQTKNKNVSTKNKTTIKEQLELQKEESKEIKCKNKWWTYNKSQDLCYKVIELE